MAAYEDALQIFSGFVTEEMEKMVLGKFSQLMTKVNSITEFDKSSIVDKDVEAAVNNVESSVKLTFVHARSYVSKCNELASYVSNEESFVIELIKKGEAEDFRDYLEEVLDKSQSCQRDIETLIEFINVHDKSNISKQEDLVEEKRSQAKKKAILTGVGGLGAAGAAAAACGAALFFPAIPAAVGLGVAIVGLTLAIDACDSYMKYQSIVSYCNEALEVIKDLRAVLEEVETRLKRVNALLKEAIDEKIEDISEHKLDKLSEGKSTVSHSLIHTVQLMSTGARRLKDYCQPLIKADTLDDFMQLL